MGNMVQYSIWSNCCNNCDFCLRKERIPYSREKQLLTLRRTRKNLDFVDWKDKFSDGISLLGGELYYIEDKELQDEFMLLIDDIIEKVLKVSPNPNVKYSTVTNGIYNPEFLYRVIDRIVDKVGIQAVDLNFSYDIKYRYKNEERRKLVLKNINDFHQRYNYKVGVQMILTQYVIDMWKRGEFDVNKFIDENIPGNTLCFLYPHPIETGLNLTDFNFKRRDLFDFLKYLKEANYFVYVSFMLSTMNSCSYKYTGLKNRTSLDFTEEPKFTDGKEILTECGHSILYRCYTDSDKCLLCDLMAFDEEVFNG